MAAGIAGPHEADPGTLVAHRVEARPPGRDLRRVGVQIGFALGMVVSVVPIANGMLSIGQ